jgi:hypothetical protein
MATFTEKDGLRDGRHPGKGQRPYHCSPRQRLGSKPSKWSTCCIVTSLRNLSNSTPGMFVPRIRWFVGWEEKKKDRSVPTLFESDQDDRGGLGRDNRSSRVGVSQFT